MRGRGHIQTQRDRTAFPFFSDKTPKETLPFLAPFRNASTKVALQSSKTYR